MRFQYFILSLFLVLFSCKHKTNLTSADLKGKWKFDKVIRNGKESRTMESAYFVFPDDKTVSSNLFDNGETATFNIDNSKLYIQGTSPMEFDIRSFEKDSLELVGRMNAFEMEFFLVKEQN